MKDISLAQAHFLSLGLTTFLYGVSRKLPSSLDDGIVTSVERHFFYALHDHDGCHDPERH